MLDAGPRIHHRHSKDRPPLKNRRRDPAASLPVVKRAHGAIQLVDAVSMLVVWSPRFSLSVATQISKAQNVRLRLVHILEILAVEPRAAAIAPGAVFYFRRSRVAEQESPRLLRTQDPHLTFGASSETRRASCAAAASAMRFTPRT